MRRVTSPFVVLVVYCALPPLVAVAVVLAGPLALVPGGVVAVGYLVLVALTRWVRPDLRLPGRAEARHATTCELCLAWNRSDEMLRRSRPRHQVRLALLRQAYLDELECRDRAGFSRWLATVGESDPGVHIRGGSPH